MCLSAYRGLRVTETGKHQLPLSWHLWLDSIPHRGAWNMAADYTLLRLAQSGQRWLRLYQWNPPCLSFGRNEPALTRYDSQQIANRGIDVVRRPTGGRAVWHVAEVTYAVAAPIALFGSLFETYLAVHQFLARALAGLGIWCRLAEPAPERRAGLAAGACFASPAGGEILADGRKLVGSAQVREGDAFLQHGSILLEDHQDVVRQVTRGSAHEPAATSISAIVGRSVGFGEVADVVVAEAKGIWPGTWTSGSAAPVTDLLTRFSDPAWIWRR